MATPASSATSPSPPMAYLSHSPPTSQPPPPSAQELLERDQRQKAVQKFLARAEISMVTRALRARLSYASYKATHNIPHVPLRDLEAQSSHNQAASFSRTIAAKRKASGLPYQYAPGTPGPSSSPAGGPPRKAPSGAMLPPSAGHSARTLYHPSVNGQPGSAGHGEMASSSRHPSNTAPNLYTSILAPPPAKQARTIHNASDPPVPAPTRPAPSPRPRPLHKSPRTEVGRSHVKSRHSDKPSKSTHSPDRRKAKRASADKGKRKQGSMREDPDGDVDMKAAATLTSLLFHHRQPIGSASSPRSSIDGSDTGSTMSYSHFAQSSTRTTTGAVSASSAAPPPSTSSTEAPLRHRTPPSAPVQDQTTPRAGHSDKEAADLMLFLATSPSPARPSKERDHAAFQMLSGDSARPKGRVLFQSGSASDHPSMESSGGAGSLQPPSTLARSGDGSFVSSVSSIGTELGSSRNIASPPLRTLSSTPSQLLPPPPLSSSSLPQAPPSPRSAAKRAAPTAEVPKPGVSQGPPIDFNFHDFINASPSPSRSNIPQGHKPNHSLRADVGRKLFEEEQMRFAAQGLPLMGNPHGGSSSQSRGEGGQPHPAAIPQQSWNAGVNMAQT